MPAKMFMRTGPSSPRLDITDNAIPRTEPLPDCFATLAMTDVAIDRWTASDGTELAWREVGEGRAVVLLHGLFSDSKMNWIKFGHAERIAREGFRVIMPDLRAHGDSGKPHEPDTQRFGNGGARIHLDSGVTLNVSGSRRKLPARLMPASIATISITGRT